ncbi:MAG: diacylglycerol kinase family protein [Caldilineaceae bacterium]|nr:diacylglycerol kinase family protein [Caldilineaceae bacterium]
MPQHSVWRSMGFAFEGLRYAFSNQRSLRIESIIAGFIVVIGFALDISGLEWVIVIISISFVIGLELVNTAIEAVVDLVSPEFHPVAKAAKDVASAAVLTSGVGGLVAGLVIFGAYILGDRLF